MTIKRNGVLNPDGYLINTPDDGSAETVVDCVNWVDCGRVWTLLEAIGHAMKQKMGFCAKCNGIHCPRPECEACVPQEKWLDWKEKGVDLFGASELELSFLPVSVPCLGIPGKA